MYAPSGGSLNISCLVSIGNDSLNGTRKFYWFLRTWRDPEKLENVIDCKQGNSSEKYNCKQGDTGLVLEIHNISIQDSGKYHCALFQKNNLMFGNGTALITGASSMSNSSVTLLAPLLPPSNIIQLACAVNVSCNITQWTWNVSGVCHKGKIICRENHDGNWTCVNLLSLSSHSWSYGDNVTCEVWCNSSPILDQWRIPEKAVDFSTKCRYWLISALIFGFLLLLPFIAHFTWTYGSRLHNKLKSDEVWETDGNYADEIAYAELNVHALNSTHGRRKLNS
ncbi:uncharacterized protein LOC120920561 [Rana temporaria]|uniref:uncharacterized protein LOC120920561 n=1 Tax=Rana temporaria TaxID=8407 RepID=UPI001AADD830|nr:uncharacterized protein LOC120920561 [Rana temporaria]